MNLAALWQLPVLFLCENNRYAMGTALERSESQPDLTAKAASYAMPAASVDGMDVLAVEEAVRAATGAVRTGTGPRFLELHTYRFRAHSMYDPDLYRPREEIEDARRRDPIELLAGRLDLADGERDALEAEVTAEVDRAVAYAEAGTPEPTEDLLRFVYAEETA
jgi:TPP-dependent pyruvate/acetoin dehydrogenase alpha subunit